MCPFIKLLFTIVISAVYHERIVYLECSIQYIFLLDLHVYVINVSVVLLS